MAPMLEAEIYYCHFLWEEKSKWHKGLSYLGKFLMSMIILCRERPNIIIIQLPPTPLLYVSMFYSILFNAKLICDCHNAMIQGSWIHWPFVQNFLTKTIVVVHNHFIFLEAREKLKFDPIVLRDGFENSKFSYSSTVLKKFGLIPGEYVILPWNIAKDEPLSETFAAAEQMPEKKFVLTWHRERIPFSLRKIMPSNIVLTGFLEDEEFASVFFHAGAALVLTNREGTQLSGMAEAIAFNVPAVISDLKTTRALYEDAACYVKNTPNSIIAGIRETFCMADVMRSSMKRIRNKTEIEISSQIGILKQFILLT